MKSVLLAAVVALSVASCGDGGTDNQLLAGGGIAGTGRTTGPITGFGSIFVGGVEWDLSGARISVNGRPATEGQLALGMVVTVEGRFSSGGAAGTADTVDYERDLEGPVASIAAHAPGSAVKELQVLGTTVIVEVGTTTFARGTDPEFSFETIAVGDVVEISGLIDEAGRIRATRVEKESEVQVGETEVELSGSVADYDGDSRFRIGAVDISFDPTGETTTIRALPGGLQDGVIVKVQGVLISEQEVWATEIEGVGDGSPGGDVEDASVEGFITRFVDLSEFRVAGQPIDAASARIALGGPELLRDGLLVKVQGPVRDGVLVAETVEIRTHTAQMRAQIRSADDIDVAAGTVVILGLRVEVGSSTHLESDGQAIKLSDVRAGDMLLVSGQAVANGSIAAARVEVVDDPNIFLQGPLEALDADAGTVTLFGLEIGSDEHTRFENDEHVPISREEFFGAMRIGDLVRVEDADDGDATSIDVADEMEFGS